MTSLAQFNDFINMVAEAKAGTYNLNNRVYATVMPSNKPHFIFRIELESAPLEVHDLKSSPPSVLVDKIIQLVTTRDDDQNLALEINGIKYYGTLQDGYIRFGQASENLPPMQGDAKQGYYAEPREFLEKFLLQPNSRVLIPGSQTGEDCFFIDRNQGQWIYIQCDRVMTTDNPWTMHLMAATLRLYNATNKVVPDLSACEINQINQQVGDIADLPPELSDMVASKLTI